MNRLLVEIEKLKKEVAQLKKTSRSSQDSVVKVDNASGVQINAGKVVYISDAGTARPEVNLADNTSLAQASKTVGVVPYDIANGSSAYIVSNGYIRDIDTSSFAAGDTLYLGTSGNITNAQPSAPNAVLILGVCIVSDASNGIIYVNPKLLTDTSGASSPTNPEYVTMSADVGLANERVLTAGNAITLTDGGAGGTATLDVGVSGLGLTVDANNVILTSSSNPGAAARILARDASGYLTVQRLGIGTTPSTYELQVTGSAYLSGDSGIIIYSPSGKAIRSTGSNNGSIYIDYGTLYVRDADAGVTAGLVVGSNDRFIIDYATGNVGIGTGATISAKLHVVKSTEQLRLGYDATYFSSFTVDNTGDLSIDTVGDTIKVLANNSIETDNYFSQTTGWSITYPGHGDFRSIYADELRVKAFIAEIYQALVGAIIITKSRAKLSRDFVVPIYAENITAVNTATEVFSIAGDLTAYISASDTFVVANSTGNDGTWTVDSVVYNNPNTEITVTGDITDATVDGDISFQQYLYVEDLDDPSWADTPVFADNDYIRLRIIDFSGGGLIIADVWGLVTGSATSDLAGGEQRWTFTPIDDGGAPWSTINAGSLALDYGQSGDGVWEATVLDAAGSPYSQVKTWTSDPSVPANFTVHTRIGNIDGISGFGEQYGIWAGQGVTVNDSQIVLTDTTAEIRNLNLYVTAGSVNKVILNATTPYISVGSTAPTGYLSNDGFWVGNVSGTYKMHVGDIDGESLRWDGANIGIYANDSNYLLLSGTTLSYVANAITVLSITNTPSVTIGRTGTTNANVYIASNTLKFRYDTTDIIDITAGIGTTYIDIGVPHITRIGQTGVVIDSDSTLSFRETISGASAYMVINGAIGGSSGTQFGYVKIPEYPGGDAASWNRLDLEAEYVGSGTDARITLYSQGDGTEYIRGYINNTEILGVYQGYATVTGYLNVTDYIVAQGGLRVGSATDPGTNNLSVAGFYRLPTSTELTISGGAITVTHSVHTVDTQADAASDDLDNINGGTTGDLLILRSANGARVVTVKDGTGNLRLAGDCILDATGDTITLYYDGSGWIELSRSNNA